MIKKTLTLRSSHAALKPIPVIIAGAVFSFGLWYIISDVFNLSQYIPAAIVFGLIVLYILKKMVNIKTSYINYTLLGAILFFALSALIKVAEYFSEIQPWDFPSFYLFSKVGQSGGNFYDPKLFFSIYEKINLAPYIDSYFIPQLVSVGFVYPPPTMLLLLPVAIMDVFTAFVLWQTVLTVFWALDIYLLYMIYKKNSVPNSLQRFHLYSISLIILTFPGLTDALFYSQTNSILLFLLLLTTIYSDYKKSGIYLTLMMVVKPISAIFFIYFFLTKKWSVLLVSTLTGLIILLITGFAFGFDIFSNYFSSLPTNRIPDTMFSEPINKSLQAVLIRYSVDNQLALNGDMLKGILFFISLILLGVISSVSLKLNRNFSNLSFLAFVPLALIIYPATLVHYSMFLLPVIVILYITLYHKLPYLMVLVFLLILMTMSVNLFYMNISLIVLLIYAGFSETINQFTARAINRVVSKNTINFMNQIFN